MRYSGATCFVILLIAGCAQLSLKPKTSSAGAAVVAPAAMELVSSFLNCAKISPNLHSDEHLQGGQYFAWFDLDPKNPHVASFRVREATLPNTARETVLKCSAIAISNADNKLRETSQETRYKLLYEYNSERTIVIRGLMLPEPVADIMSESGTVLVHLPFRSGLTLE